MDIARTREATVNDMKSLALQSASAVETNIDAVRQSSNMQCGKWGLHHRKKCPAYGTRCRKCRQNNHWEQVCKNKQVQERQFRPLPQPLFEGQKVQDKTEKSKVHSAKVSSDFEELLIETIWVDSTYIGVERDKTFVKIKVKLPDINNPNVMLKVKVDTGKYYGNRFLNHLNENGFRTGTKPTQTKLTAYNGTSIAQRGIYFII